MPAPVDCAPYPCAGPNCAGGCSDANPCAGDNYCKSGKCAPKLPGGTSCQNAQQCSSGYCTDGVCCDKTCGGDCEACNLPGKAGVCTFQQGNVCRDSAGDCDPAETCPGNASSCPPNQLQPASFVCRPVAGACDVAESCTGSSPTCPPDTFKDGSTTCRPAAGLCDLVEQCPGNSPACPPDQVKILGTQCRASAGVCDIAESCDGATGGCPTDQFSPTTTSCGTPASCSGSTFNPGGKCNGAGTCVTGMAQACGTFACSATGCNTSCNQDGDCATGLACSGGSCVVPVVSVAVGIGHTCAALSTGKVMCWGDNSLGQLGNGTTTGESLKPVEVPGISNAAKVFSGGQHTCALTSNQRVRCWGSNFYGESGVGGSDIYAPNVTAITVTGGAELTSVTQLSTTTGFACALSGGTLLCWGANTESQQAKPADTMNHPVATAVSGLGTVAFFSIGFNDVMTFDGGSTLKGWGNNYSQQVSAMTTNPIVSPASTTQSNVVELAMANQHGCLRLQSGDFTCFGSGYGGELGDGTPGGMQPPPGVAHTLKINRVVSGVAHSCARGVDGHIYCWGDNQYGAIGDGTTTTPRSVPTQVIGLGTDIADVVAGSSASHNCVIRQGGALLCWGKNDKGQLGTGTKGDNATQPRPVSW